MVFQYWHEVISLGLLVIFICIEVAYRQPLYDYSLELIARWQARETSQATRNFFNFVSEFNRSKGTMALVVCAYNFTTRKTFLKFCLACFVASNMIGFFKSFYHNPRPYYSSDSVKALYCSLDYGNPSGHAIGATGIYGSLWVLSFLDKSEGTESVFSKAWQRYVAMWGTFVLLLLLIACTFAARLYLGVHSLNHLIYGLTLGVWIAYTCGIVVTKYVELYLKSIETLNRGCIFPAGAVAVAAVAVLVQVLNVALYLAYKTGPEYLNNDWIARINAKCGSSLTRKHPAAITLTGNFGALVYVFVHYGQMLSARYFNPAFMYWLRNLALGKTFLRLVVVIVIMGVCYIPFFAIPSLSLSLNIFLKVLLPSLLVAFPGLLLCDWISVYCGLIGSPPPKLASQPPYDAIPNQ